MVTQYICSTEQECSRFGSYIWEEPKYIGKCSIFGRWKCRYNVWNDHHSDSIGNLFVKDVGYDGNGECGDVDDGGNILGENEVVSGTVEVDVNLISDESSIEGKVCTLYQ